LVISDGIQNLQLYTGCDSKGHKKNKGFNAHNQLCEKIYKLTLVPSPNSKDLPGRFVCAINQANLPGISPQTGQQEQQIIATTNRGTYNMAMGPLRYRIPVLCF
jgi:hypothetical protein